MLYMSVSVSLAEHRLYRCCSLVVVVGSSCCYVVVVVASARGGRGEVGLARLNLAWLDLACFVFNNVAINSCSLVGG